MHILKNLRIIVNIFHKSFSSDSTRSGKGFFRFIITLIRAERKKHDNQLLFYKYKYKRLSVT